MKKCTIVGKQPLKVMPNFPYKDSYGLNQAALWHRTEFGFSGHKPITDEYKAHRGVQFITIDPCFELKHIENAYDYIKWDAHETRSYDCSVEYCLKYVKSAINGEDIAYPNRLTILHMALFYVLKKGYKDIDLIGCANNYDELLSSDLHDRQIAPMMREFTGSMVEAMQKCGINVNWRKEESAILPPLELQKIPDLTILNAKGYFFKHMRLCGKYKTGEEAWEVLEDEYYELTKKNRFKSYESFRVMKTRFFADRNNR